MERQEQYLLNSETDCENVAKSIAKTTDVNGYNRACIGKWTFPFDNDEYQKKFQERVQKVLSVQREFGDRNITVNYY